MKTNNNIEKIKLMFEEISINPLERARENLLQREGAAVHEDSSTASTNQDAFSINLPTRSNYEVEKLSSSPFYSNPHLKKIARKTPNEYSVYSFHALPALIKKIKQLDDKNSDSKKYVARFVVDEHGYSWFALDGTPGDRVKYLNHKTNEHIPAHDAMRPGSNIVAAGDVFFSTEYKIKGFSNSSGHYMPSEKTLAWFIASLLAMEADFTDTIRMLFVGLDNKNNLRQKTILLAKNDLHTLFHPELQMQDTIKIPNPHHICVFSKKTWTYYSMGEEPKFQSNEEQEMNTDDPKIKSKFKDISFSLFQDDSTTEHTQNNRSAANSEELDETTSEGSCSSNDSNDISTQKFNDQSLFFKNGSDNARKYSFLSQRTNSDEYPEETSSQDINTLMTDNFQPFKIENPRLYQSPVSSPTRLQAKNVTISTTDSIIYQSPPSYKNKRPAENVESLTTYTGSYHSPIFSSTRIQAENVESSTTNIEEYNPTVSSTTATYTPVSSKNKKLERILPFDEYDEIYNPLNNWDTDDEENNEEENPSKVTRFQGW